MNKDLFMLVLSLENDFCEWSKFDKGEDIKERIRIDESFEILFVSMDFRLNGEGVLIEVLYVLLYLISLGLFGFLAIYVSKLKPIIKIKDAEYTPTFMQGFKILQMKKRVVKRIKATHKQQQAENSINFISKKYYECQD